MLLNSFKRLLISVFLVCGISCKVPIINIEASFSLADSAWFAEEETLFIFYRVKAQQGLGDPSIIEITYSTDDERIRWTEISELTKVHTHIPVNCGIQALCGSTSIHVSKEPREVAIRLRYNRDGELSLNSQTVLNVVSFGPAHSNRSFIVYGTFDETNQYIQWRGRHQFPTLRNHEVEDLGLKRNFTIEKQRYGTAQLASIENPYGYGSNCPSQFILADFSAVTTNERAIFNTDALPIQASDTSSVCSLATVKDATGLFKTTALAQKNPEVRAAFPVLRSPINDATPIRFFLAPCEQNISNIHKNMQKQRLLFTNENTYCIDDWQEDDFLPNLVEEFRNNIETERPNGNDMVLVIGLHHDESEDLALVIEEALNQVVPGERDRSTPRLVGAFVFDSNSRAMDSNELRRLTLWCPSVILEDGFDFPKTNSENFEENTNIFNQQRNFFAENSVNSVNSKNEPTNIESLIDASIRTCAVAPDNMNLELSAFSFGILPILPSRKLYLDFIDTYSESQTGKVKTLSFRAPEFTPTTDNIDLDGMAIATFLNNELISADPLDAFSYCAQAESAFFVFRSEFTSQIGQEVIPIEYLPEWHNNAKENTYYLGIAWDFPFLLRMKYEAVVAGSISAFSLSVPFGISSTEVNYYGTEMWTQSDFSLKKILTQCTRFCDHPTFDSAGVYNVTKDFRTYYLNTCYNPKYPQLSDSGFPYDP